MFALASPQIGTNCIQGSVLHPDFVTEQELHLSSYFSLALPTSFQAGGLCASAEAKAHKWTDHGILHTYQLLHETRHELALTKEIIAEKGKSSLLADVCRFCTYIFHITHKLGVRCDQVITF